MKKIIILALGLVVCGSARAEEVAKNDLEIFLNAEQHEVSRVQGLLYTCNLHRDNADRLRHLNTFFEVPKGIAVRLDNEYMKLREDRRKTLEQNFYAISEKYAENIRALFEQEAQHSDAEALKIAALIKTKGSQQK